MIRFSHEANSWQAMFLDKRGRIGYWKNVSAKEARDLFDSGMIVN